MSKFTVFLNSEVEWIERGELAELMGIKEKSLVEHVSRGGIKLVWYRFGGKVLARRFEVIQAMGGGF